LFIAAPEPRADARGYSLPALRALACRDATVGHPLRPARLKADKLLERENEAY